MKKLRSIHLYLGCIFAPMLLFFAISGIWQTLGLRSPILQWLSSIHTAVRFKNGHELSSPVLRYFVVVMSLAFIVTTILGVVMAVKFGQHRMTACLCLVFGALFPLVMIFIKAFA